MTCLVFARQYRSVLTAGSTKDGLLVGHNVRFDLGFLEQETSRLLGRRIASPTLDTVLLVRRILAGRIESASLAALAHFFGTSVEPCHRALADARATAEILTGLIELAREDGAPSPICSHCVPAAPPAPPR